MLTKRAEQGYIRQKGKNSYWRNEIRKDRSLQLKEGLSLRKVPLLENGSPSWTNLELLRAFLTKAEPIVGNKKGHTLFGYGL
jgi:hypothetical protein